MVEPTRKSMYDVLKHNLKVSGRRTYLHRYYYLGAMSTHAVTYEDEIICLGELYKRIVQSINEEYCHEKLTGIIITTEKFFLVVIDGSEDAIIKHFQRVLKAADHIFVQIKLLVSCHHINQRFFDVFDYKMVTPPTLLEKIDPESDFDETMRQLDICIRKLFHFCANVRVHSDYAPTTIGEITPDLYQYLPECNLMEFILNTDYPLDIREINRHFNVIPKMDYYTEKIWPVRDDFVPYDVFDKDKNPVPCLPGQVEREAKQ